MPESIVCPRCGLRSYHPKDIEAKYCARCHEWHANMPEIPSFCFSCGVSLRGGATKHEPGCKILGIIGEVFGADAARQVTKQ